MADVKHKNLIGAKGGSQQQRQPVEAPDSLRSTSYARVLDLLSEGEIVGLVDGAKSIFLDETPVQNSDDSFNFENVNFESRTGTPDQSYLAGFPAVENEIAVGVELRPDLPFVRQITNTSLSAVKVRLSTPQLSKADTSTGDISGHTVEYVIDLAVDGGQYETIARTAFRGKTSSKYERNHRIDLPRATEGWLLRVRRITPMANSSSTADMTFVESYTEIIDAKLRYPNSALVGVSVDAEQFSNVPSRAYHAKGRIIRIPSNYDPVARTYNDLWDGTFKTAYTNNPAWVYFDLVTHPRYGLGHLVDDYHVDKWALYKIGRYCDEMVPDGYGGMEPRFSCNAYFQTRADAYKVLMDLTSIFRGLTFWANEQIITAADMPEDPVYLYNPSNVIDGKFQYAGTSKKARHTVALVSWNDMTDFGRVKLEYVEDPGGVARYGVHQIEATAIGCTSQGQAHRCGNWMLLTERYETDTVTFSVGLDGTLTHPGQIIEIMDPLRAGSRLGGRIAGAAGQVITVDAMPTPAPEQGDAITVVLPSGVSQRRLISHVNVEQRTITVDRAFDETPEAEAVWAVESSTLKTQLYRVLGVTENEDLTFTITALQHEPGKFDAADQGVRLDERPTVGRPRPTIDAPDHVTLTAYERAGEVTASTIVTVDWAAVQGANHYIVQWRRNSGTWSAPMQIDGLSYDIEGAFAGVYEARVAAVSRTASSRPRMSGPLEVSDQALPPKMVERLSQDLVDAQRALGEEELARAQEDAVLAQALADEAAALAQGLADEAIARADAIAQETRDRAQALSDEAAARDAAIADEAAARAQGLADEAAARAQEIAAERNARIQAIGDEATARAQEIAAERTARTDAIAAEMNARVQAQEAIAETARQQANAARDAAIAYADVIGAQVADILEADEWDQDNEYPAGDLTQASGKLYRALQDVPAGVPITNTDYWQLVGNYSSLGAAVAGSIEIGTQNTSDIAAESARLSGLMVRVPAGDGKLGTEAQILAVEQAAADGNSANATRIEAVEASLGDLEAEVGTKASASAVSALDSRVEAAEGQISSHSGALTSLQNDLSDLEGEVAGKASSAALQALDSRVEANEGQISSHSGSITSLQNDLSGLETEVGTKASSAALQALDSRVEANEDSIASHSGSITSLENDLSDLETEVGTKASSSALQSLDSRVESTEGQISSHSGSITSLQNNLSGLETEVEKKASSAALSALDSRVTNNEGAIASQSAAVTQLRVSLGDVKADSGVPTFRQPDEPQITGVRRNLTSHSEGPMAFYSHKVGCEDDGPAFGFENWVRIKYDPTNLSYAYHNLIRETGKTYTASLFVRLDSGEMPRIGSAFNFTATGMGNPQLTAVDGIPGVYRLSGTFVQSSGSTFGLVNRVGLTDDVLVTGFQMEEAEVASSYQRVGFPTDFDGSGLPVGSIWHKTNDNDQVIQTLRYNGSGWDDVSDLRAVNAASAEALSQLSSRVDDAEGVITSQGSSITSLTNEVAGKASSAALQALDSRVEAAEGNVSSNSSAITSLQNDLGDLETEVGTKASASALSTLEGRVSSNEGQIASQSSALTNLRNDLEDLGGVVDSKASSAALQALDSRVSSNEGEIASQSSAITNLQSDIGLLDEEINSKASSAALSALDSRVTANEGEIEGVSGQLTALSTAVDGKADGAALSELESRVDVAEGAITSGSDSIIGLQNQVADLSGELSGKASSAALNALGSRVSVTENAIDSQGQAITSLENDVGNLQSDVETKASSAAVQALDSRVSTAENEVASNSGAITTLQNSLSSIEGELNEKADASALSALDSRVAANEDGLLSTSSSVTALENAIEHPSAGLASKASSSALQSLTNEVRHSETGLPSKASASAVTALQNQINDPATGLASKASASALSALETTVSEIEVAASDMLEMSARLGTVEGALINEMITSAQKDAALTSSVNLLESRMEDAEAGVVATAGALDGLTTRVTSVEGTVSSHSSSLTSLQAQVNALDVDAGGSGAAIAELDTRVTEAEGRIDSQGNAITALQNSVTSANKTFIQSTKPSTSGRTPGDLWIDTANGNRIWGFSGSDWVLRQDSNKNAVFVQGTQPVARAVNDLWFDTSRNNRQFRWDGSKWVEVSDARVTANASAISSLTTRVSNAEGVNTTQSQQITTLENTVNHSSTGVAATANAVSSLTNRVTTAEGKIATNSSSITSLRNTVNNSTTGVIATANALSALTTRVTNAESVNTSQGSAITSLQNTVNHGTTGVAATASALSALRTRVTNAEGTLTSQASSISSLSTTVGNHTTTITSHASSINGLRGRAGVTVNSNGHITGWALNNDGKTGDMTIVADRFKIVTPGQTARTPFSLSSSRLQLATDLYMGAGRIVSESDGYMKVQGTGFGTNNQFIEWFGPKMAINNCSESNAISYHLKSGAIKTGGLIEGSLISAGALQLNSTRIHTGGGRLAPFTLKDVAYFGRPSGQQSMTLTLSGFQAPNRGSGYHSKRFAAHKMDVFLEALVHGDTGMETVHIDVQYNGGSWEQILSFRQNTHNLASFGLVTRYTTKTSWNTVAFRARTSEGRTSSMSFKLDVANYNESGNVAHSYSGMNASGGVGGTPGSGGGGEFDPGAPSVPGVVQ